MIMCRLFVMFCLFCLSQTSYAHEVRPASLEIEQNADNQINVIWKLPITNGKKLRLFPTFPAECKLPDDSQQKIIDGIIVESWQMQCALDKGTISISGLENVLTDVFVRIKRSGQAEQISLLRPSDNIMDLSEPEGAAFGEYIVIGVEHMIFGWDHLLFVLALLLIVSRRQIFWVITAFTLGHSITLGVTALGLLTLPSGPIELLVALSIFFLAIEAMRKLRASTSITIEYPWIVAIAFGLLHGLGFAGALAEIGLPTGNELWALAMFNIGIELGQILFIIIAALLYALNQRMGWFSAYKIKLMLIYMLGTMGAYFTLTRIF